MPKKRYKPEAIRLETIVYRNTPTKAEKNLVLAYLDNKWGKPGIIKRFINNVVIVMYKKNESSAVTNKIKGSDV